MAVISQEIMGMREKILYNVLTKYFVYYPLYFFGRISFKIFSKTPALSFLSFRKLYCLTKGGINESLSKQARNSHGKYNISSVVDDVIPEFDSDTALNSIRDVGYYRIPTLLSHEIVSVLNKVGRECLCHVESIDRHDGKVEKFDENNPLGTRYFIKDACLMNCGAIIDVMNSRRMMSVAQEFLGCKPIIDLVLMWWLTDHEEKASSKAAQLFHFDMDRPKFLKVFFYLTDVSEENAPHIYADSSNRIKPDKLFKIRRFSDTEINEHYQISHLTGKSGTILIVDTSGFHKGGIVTGDPRLILQLEYSDSLFGADYPEYKITTDLGKFTAMKAEYPRTFQLFNT